MAAPSPRPAYHHRGGEPPLLGETIDQMFRRIASARGDAEAVVSLAQGVRCGYATLDRCVEALARGLLALGVAKGDRIAIWSTSNLEWIVCQLGTARIGAVLVNLNPAWRAAEVAEALARAEVHGLVFIPRFRSSDYAAILREACPEAGVGPPEAFRSARLPHLRWLIAVDPDAPESGAVPAGLPAARAWRGVLDAGRTVDAAAMAARAATLDPDDPINIQFTSGTTGFPKAVVLTHHNILNNGFFVGELMRLAPADRVCVPVPFYHCFGMVVATLGALTHGATLVVPAPHFDAEATLRAVCDERCTVLHGVPTMFLGVCEAQARLGLRPGALRTGIMAGAPCPPALLRRVREDLGCRDILVGYGQTEASPVTHGTRPDDSIARRLETVGTNLPHQEVKVVDPASGRTVAVGESGEVCFRGYHVMRGYYRQPDATRKAIDEAGWLHSGDLGEMDAEGYVRITGRLKDLIIRGGEKIHPTEVERLFDAHPDVADVAVFGVPDPAMGEEVAAWVRLKPGAAAAPEALRAWARGRIAHYKIPRHVWCVAEFPLTATGKIQKFRMREQSVAWLAAATR